MGLKRMRCDIGKTISDVSKEVGISKEYLRDFESGRRQLEMDDIQKLSKCYAQDTDKIYEEIKSMRKESERDIESMSEAISKYGYFPNAQRAIDKEMKIFLYLMNDIWDEFNKKYFGNIEDNPNSIVEKMLDFKYSLLKKEALKYNNKCQPNAFIYTYSIESSPKQCWIEIYSGDETKGGYWLMLIKDFGVNILAYDFPEEFEELVIKIKKKMGDSKQDLRIFHYYPNEYVEINEKGKQLFRSENIHFKIKEKRGNRLYRRIMKAKDLPNMFFRSNSDCRCKEHKKGICPMKSDVVPNEDNGCSYCEGIMKSWEAREFIIGKITDDKFRNLKSFYEFKEKYTEHGKMFYEKYREESENIYRYAYIFSNFEIHASDNIKIYNGSNYENGRHRTKIAKNMGIEIPVLWGTYEKMDEELIE
ncbi:helix-turn-helix domain-containing protein [Oceanirhabdus sp. W0125-5]|uniref:helix-turn-helix domain-containing protein n=1 Tax=Oceanirhabdus sp. W0125-5 TaxID=2999116 RepID=UPI0022F348FC|nr:helix-turn-helix transcriptional regulator [Oceanirhabdus sp. W0125-5]WBW95253.1 helix-turn-helix transcriptional regulator [Oceanirhabdus sp. W0125-5]